MATIFHFRVGELQLEGLIKFNDEVSLSTDLQPESIRFNKDETKAFVVLQVNCFLMYIEKINFSGQTGFSVISANICCPQRQNDIEKKRQFNISNTVQRVWDLQYA